MLVKSGFLQHGAPLRQLKEPFAAVTGRNLAHAQRSTAERALIGADLHCGYIGLIKPTIKQCSALVDVCVPCVAAGVTIVDDQAARAAALAGDLTILEAAKAAAQPTETLAEHILRSSPEELKKAGATIGVGTVFDTMVVPNI